MIPVSSFPAYATRRKDKPITMLLHSNCDWFIILPLLATSTVLKRRTKRRNNCSVDHKLKLRASDYEFDSVASGKQSFVWEPSLIALTHAVAHEPTTLVSTNDSSLQTYLRKN